MRLPPPPEEPLLPPYSLEPLIPSTPAESLLLAIAGPDPAHLELQPTGDAKCTTLPQPVTLELVQRMLAGTCSPGTTLTYPNGLTRALAFDGDSPEQRSQLQAAAITLSGAGAIPLLEDSPSIDPAVDRNRMAVMGTSRSGELALLLAAYDRRLKAAISYSGSGVVAPSVRSFRVPAWTWHGKPIPWAHSTVIPHDAVIPVQQINGPFLLIAGKDDRLWPSSVLLRVAMVQAHSLHDPFADQLLTYTGAGHLIQPPYLPVAASIGSQFGGDARDQEHADVDSWMHVLHLLTSRFSA